MDAKRRPSQLLIGQTLGFLRRLYSRSICAARFLSLCPGDQAKPVLWFAGAVPHPLVHLHPIICISDAVSSTCVHPFHELSAQIHSGEIPAAVLIDLKAGNSENPRLLWVVTQKKQNSQSQDLQASQWNLGVRPRDELANTSSAVLLQEHKVNLTKNTNFTDAVFDSLPCWMSPFLHNEAMGLTTSSMACLLPLIVHPSQDTCCYSQMWLSVAPVSWLHQGGVCTCCTGLLRAQANKWLYADYAALSN